MSLPAYPQTVDNRTLAATEELGGIFAFNLDDNRGYPSGTCELQLVQNESKGNALN